MTNEIPQESEPIYEGTYDEIQVKSSETKAVFANNCQNEKEEFSFRDNS